MGSRSGGYLEGVLEHMACGYMNRDAFGKGPVTEDWVPGVTCHRSTLESCKGGHAMRNKIGTELLSSLVVLYTRAVN